eukprot:scaffold7704_cov112-Isochrysis_galbana.AAC.4
MGEHRPGRVARRMRYACRSRGAGPVGRGRERRRMSSNSPSSMASWSISPASPPGVPGHTVGT